MTFAEILEKSSFSKEELITLIGAQGDNQKLLFEKSREIMLKTVGNKVYFRGLIEYSNYCIKDCLYCGIRKSNHNVSRYSIDIKDVIEAAKYAHEKGYGSIVLQAGERTDPQFIATITELITQIKDLSNNQLGITLSLGEQSKETYQAWFNAGAHRYLLRIESSNKELYEKIHPTNSSHNHQTRLNCLQELKNIGYQVGTGIMIGLPFQTFDHLAEDLQFMKEFYIDMVGMGPYIEHEETPLYIEKESLMTQQRRFDITLNMIAILRLMMNDINIAAATALQAIDKMGREKALRIGANIIMPNITPTENRKNYSLYQNKPCIDEGADDCANCITVRIEMAGGEVGINQWGDSKHFSKKQPRIDKKG